MREQFHIISSENQSLLGYITVLPEDNITPLMRAAMTANTGEINRQINRYHADVNQVGLSLYSLFGNDDYHYRNIPNKSAGFGLKIGQILRIFGSLCLFPTMGGAFIRVAPIIGVIHLC